MALPLLTIPMLRDRFPDGGPSERCLREAAQRLGLGRRWGRQFLLTEDEAECLLRSGSGGNTGMPEVPSRPRRRMAPSDGSALKKALELNRRLERGKSQPTSNDTTMTSLMDDLSSKAPASLKRR